MSEGRTIGITGHQARDGLDWDWTRSTIASVLGEAPVIRALSSLAVGSDQLFAEEALKLDIPLQAVIPFAEYERCFEGEGLLAYRALLERCSEQIVLERTGADEQAFLAAGLHVAALSDLLIAVWDGQPAEGLGGTADIVSHAISRGQQVAHLDPISRTVRRLPA